MPKCRICGDTGRLWHRKSWMVADGYYSVSCRYCGSAHRDRDFEKFQREAREAINSATR